MTILSFPSLLVPLIGLVFWQSQWLLYLFMFKKNKIG